MLDMRWTLKNACDELESIKARLEYNWDSLSEFERYNICSKLRKTSNTIMTTLTINHGSEFVKEI